MEKVATLLTVRYSLRFRVFDLSVVSPQVSPVPDLGLCESRTFKVYSPRK